jgi:mRNA-degrading endonuclease YafQ of YafQ-DinJ toxin-antitoxin module
MNPEQSDIFKREIKRLILKGDKYTVDEVHSIMLILNTLIYLRRKLAISAKYGESFNIHAMQKHRQITAAITLLEKLIKKSLPLQGPRQDASR